MGLADDFCILHDGGIRIPRSLSVASSVLGCRRSADGGGAVVVLRLHEGAESDRGQ